MLTKEQIRELPAKQLNLPMIDFVYGEVERRAADQLEIKKTSETKGAQFFGPSVNLAVALSGLAAAAAHNGFSRYAAFCLLASAVVFVLAAGWFASAQAREDYVLLGMAPEDALKEEYIIAPAAEEPSVYAEAVAPRVKLYIIANRVRWVAASVASNETKARRLREGLWLMALGAGLAVAAFASAAFASVA